MANDGQIVFEVTADGSKAEASIRDITNTIKQESAKWDQATGAATEKMGGNFASAFKSMAAGLSAAAIGKALLDIGKDAVQAASALSEVQNVVDVTFGDSASTIDAWAKTAGTAYGLTETQAKKFASTMGAMMKSSGVATKDLTSMSTALAGLSADMASFYNLDFDEAFQKIRSGISGETEPLKQLGINMSVANLEAFALSQGIQKAFKDMDQGEQTMLRYQYLMQATADAQGDFARTSDGYANSMRLLETNINTLKTSLGGVLIPALTSATGFLNDFIAKLQGDPNRKTVLDDFESIDINTDKKLEQIRATAEEARALTETLDEINGKKSTEAGKKVQELVNGLTGLDVGQDKLAVLQQFLQTLSENVGTIAAIQGTDAQGAQEWLAKISEAANTLTPEDAESWSSLLTQIRQGLPGIENTDFGQTFFGLLSSGFSGVADEADLMGWAVDALGDKTSRTADEQALWLETCKRLVQTIPGLSAIINTETGEVKGGTQAVRDYVKAWEEGRTKLAMMGALESKQTALEQRAAALPGLELEMAVQERRRRLGLETLQAVYDSYGRGTVQTDANGNVATTERTWAGLNHLQTEELLNAIDAYDDLVDSANDARDAYNNQNDALEEGRVALEEYRKTIDEMPGDIEQAADASETWLQTIGKTEDQIKQMANAARDALVNMADYAQGVRDAIDKTLDKTVSGLEAVDYHTYRNVTANIEKIREQLKNTKDGSATWKELNNELEKYNKQLITTGTIQSNLESQRQFLTDYLANLEAAQSMGLSKELLAALSDGSEQSAMYLDALVHDTTGDAAKRIDALYKEVQEKKAQLGQALTNQQLTADQVYQKMADDAKAAVSALDLQGEAATNAGATVSGIAQGIADHVPEVQTAVDSIIAQLDRLSAWGFSVNLKDFGSFNYPSASDARAPLFTLNQEKEAHIAYNEAGLSYVPFTGFLSSLHEGEAILTAEENRVWQAFKNGGGNVDYETMGNVMRDNVKPGGNVYLDGRIVGSVVSDMQGRAYRQMQRSGWQS